MRLKLVVGGSVLRSLRYLGYVRLRLAHKYWSCITSKAYVKHRFETQSSIFGQVVPGKTFQHSIPLRDHHLRVDRNADGSRLERQIETNKNNKRDDEVHLMPENHTFATPTTARPMQETRNFNLKLARLPTLGKANIEKQKHQKRR